MGLTSSHSVIQGGINFFIVWNVIIQFFPFSDFLCVSAITRYDEAAIAEIWISIFTNIFNTYKKTIFDCLFIKCTDNGNAALLMFFENLRLMRNSEKSFTVLDHPVGNAKGSPRVGNFQFSAFSSPVL